MVSFYCFLSNLNYFLKFSVGLKDVQFQNSKDSLKVSFLAQIAKTEFQPEDKSHESKVALLLETVRRLFDNSTFYANAERDSKFAEVWLHCCQEFTHSETVMLNCARILSIGTQSEEFCSHFRQPTSSLVIAQAMETCINHTDILVRYLYALGNCLAADPKCRQLNTKLPRTIR